MGGVRHRPDLRARECRVSLSIDGLDTNVFAGVFFGLVVGEIVGVVGFTWLAVRLGIGRLPERTTWGHILGVGATAGIGFTVALFVASLSFDEPDLLRSAKIGILAASTVAGMLGYTLLRHEPAVLLAATLRRPCDQRSCRAGRLRADVRSSVPVPSARGGPP